MSKERDNNNEPIKNNAGEPNETMRPNSASCGFPLSLARGQIVKQAEQRRLRQKGSESSEGGQEKNGRRRDV
jgi:hypothetical protein